MPKQQRKQQSRLVIGDRVEEIKNFGDHCIQKSHPQYDKITSMIHTRRRGNVVGFEVKRNSRGHAINYAMVVWDQFKTPTQHHVMRLKRMEEASEAAA